MNDEGEEILRDRTDICQAVEALNDAAELLAEIMRDEVNHQDEAEKWLRAYAPQYLANAGEHGNNQRSRENHGTATHCLNGQSAGTAD